MRHDLGAVVGIVVAVMCVSAAIGRQAELDTTGQDALRLMSFNIRYGSANDGDNSWEHRKQLVFDVVTDQDADVVGLQEALRFQIDEITTETDGYGEIGVGRNDGATRGEACTILYKTERFSVASAGTFWLSDTPRVIASKSFGNSIPRICTWARLIDKATGDGIYILNAHFDHQSDPSRTKSAGLIAEFVRNLDFGDPVFLMGDFNAGESSDALGILTTAPKVHVGVETAIEVAGAPLFRDSFRMLHPDAQNVGTFNSWRGEAQGAKIDYILVPPSCKVAKAEIIRTNTMGRYPSDHFPVMAEVLLGKASDGGN